MGFEVQQEEIEVNETAAEEGVQDDYTFVPPEKQGRYDMLIDRAIEADDAAARDRENSADFNDLAKKRLKSAGIAAALTGATGAVFPPAAVGPGILSVAELGMSAFSKGVSVILEKRADMNDDRVDDALSQTREIVDEELLRTGATTEGGTLTMTAEQIEIARQEAERDGTAIVRPE